MRLREILREAWRDIASGAGRSATFALLHAAIVGGIVCASALSVATSVQEAREYVASGAAVAVMKAKGRIDGRSCDAMASLANVVAAGALRETEGIASARLPQTPISTFAASAGFVGLLSGEGDAGAGGLSLSRDVADTLGLRAGDPMETTRGMTKVSSVFEYPDDGRDPVLAFAAVEPTIEPTGAFDQCWALIWPQDENAVAALGRTVMAGSSRTEERPTLAQLNQTRGVRFVVTAMVRPDIAAPLLIIAGALLGGAFIFRRRLALASDRHVGVGRLSQVISQAAQVAVWAFVGSIVIAAVVIVLIRLPAHDRMPLLTQSLILTSIANGAAIAACSLAVSLLRDNALLRYFKNR